MRKRTVAIFAGAMGIGLFLGGAATAAQADTGAGWGGAFGYYNTNYDRLAAMDLQPDGYGTRVYYKYTTNGQVYNLDNDMAAGSAVTRTIGGSGSIRLWTCLKNGGATVSCSDLSQWTAR
ncbi:hypothetical protein [Leucobacter sp. wl10]|uniref:hypothetical protein n=1 Tax=Leucobacter sp. wl10 TaxID=2304677 RepID=UPI0013C34BF4|nr:hypothetical protein [Leucobacter sp. wl10]